MAVLNDIEQGGSGNKSANRIIVLFKGVCGQFRQEFGFQVNERVLSLDCDRYRVSEKSCIIDFIRGESSNNLKTRGAVLIMLCKWRVLAKCCGDHITPPPPKQAQCLAVRSVLIQLDQLLIYNDQIEPTENKTNELHKVSNTKFKHVLKL